MARVSKEIMQIAVAGAGVVAVLGYMAHLGYSSAREQHTFNQGSTAVDDLRTRIVQERMQELGTILELTPEQTGQVEQALYQFGYGDPEAWKRQRAGFFDRMREILTRDQENRVAAWEGGVRRNKYGPVPHRLRRIENGTADPAATQIEPRYR